MQKGNLIILVICQLISATGSIVMVTLGGIIGSTLSDNPAWATLPISMMVVAVAATTIPATVLMRRIGRSKGFALASLSSVIALLIAIQALSVSSFALFIVAGMLFGINMAFTQQYRYAAAESVPSKFVPRAVSFVLIGSIGGAFVGPELTIRGQTWFENMPYAGAMLAVATLYFVQFLLLLKLRGVDEAGSAHAVISSRPLRDIVLQPVYVVAVLGGTAGYGLMTLVMTATPLSMHINDGYSLEQTAAVIRAHVLGMYVPSLVSGFLIERFGVSRLMFAGALLLSITSFVGLQGQTHLHYWWSLVLLGIGWNFLYVGGTTMLTYAYTIEERFRAQAVNEFLVFGISATASLLAGTVMHYFGWFRLMLIPIPVLIIICLALLVVRRDPLLGRAVTSN
ncbi:MAG: MFS transporter [Gammaproteobacteria bacterium]|nr:MFS transporter [Gammaproteobacteria bacterium]